MDLQEVGCHLEDPGDRWEDNIKMDLQEVGCGGGHELDRSGLGQGQVSGSCNVVMNLQFPYITMNFLTSGEPVSFAEGLC